MKMPNFQDLRSKLEFWWAKKTIKLNWHYTIMYDVANDGGIAIKLLKKYPGVIIEYSDLMIGDNQLMNFNIRIIANPNLCNVESRKFHAYNARVFRSVLHDAIMNYAKETLNESRSVDTVESDSEREVYEEVAPVPKKRVSKRKPRKENI